MTLEEVWENLKQDPKTKATMEEVDKSYKLFRKIENLIVADLEAKLAESKQEINDWKQRFESSEERNKQMTDNGVKSLELKNEKIKELKQQYEPLVKNLQNQTAIAELEKAKEVVLKEVERVEEIYTDGFQSGFNCCYVFMKEQIDQQIRKLKN